MSYVLFEQKTFSKFFDSEKIIDSEGIPLEYHYQKKIIYGNTFLFFLDIDPYDCSADISLGLNNPIFSIHLDKLREINLEQNTINFYKENKNEPVLMIAVSPMISFSCKL